MCESIGLEACLEDLSHRNLRLGIQVGNHEEVFAKWDGSSCNDCRVAQRSLTSREFLASFSCCSSSRGTLQSEVTRESHVFTTASLHPAGSSETP